jgi:hypothetical protein
MTQKKYANAAERQRAHRQRVKARLAGALPVVLPPKPPRKLARPKRLAVVEAELQALMEEYETWLEAMPDNLSESDLAGQLQQTIDQLQEALDAVTAIDPPRGFGR